jgi:hypothetical protein
MRAPLLLTLALGSCLAAGQTPADLDAEPHYHLLLQNDQVRVFRLTLHQDESAFVRFRRSLLTVTLQDGEIIIWDEGKSAIQHFQVHQGETSFRWFVPQEHEQTLAGGYKNDRQNDYRNITIEFLNPYIGWAFPYGGTMNPGSMYIGGAIVADVLLQPGDSIAAPDQPGPELVISVSDLNLKSPSGARIRKSAAEATWIPADLVSPWTNHARTSARFVIVEFRPDVFN